MKVEELIVLGKKYTSSTHAKMLLAVLLEVNPLELLTILEKQVSDDIIDKYKKSLEALKNDKPIQYVIGYVNFYGLKLKVNENVLIPRFETEELVSNVKEYIEKNKLKSPKILDLGCGSGAIGLTLKKFFKDAEITMIDISDEALSIAKENAMNHNLDVKLVKSDWFNELTTDKYDVIVSNPPYIKTAEEIEEIVKNNEPSIALYGGEDGLDCYRKILKDISKYLKEKYFIAFEIGYTQKESLKKIILEYLPNSKITTKKDLSNKDRMIFVEENND